MDIEDEKLAEAEGSKKRSLSEFIAAYKTWIQLGGLVFLLLALMLTSMITGLMVVGVININPQNNVMVNNMGDAISVCDDAIKDEYRDLLQAFNVDDLSSLRDPESGGFKLYYDVNIYRDETRRTGVQSYFVNCFVSSKGRLKRLDLIEDKEFTPKPIRQTHGNPIGF